MASARGVPNLTPSRKAAKFFLKLSSFYYDFVFLVFKASLSARSGEQTIGIGCKILKINSFRPIIFDKLQNKRKKKHYYLLESQKRLTFVT